MILLVTFTDGANPVAYCGTPEHLTQTWRRISRKDNTARCLFFSNPGGMQCRAVSGGGYAVGQYFDGAHRCKEYSYLLPALKSVEKGAHA